MRKIVLVAAIAAGALSLAACSQQTEEAAEDTADSAMADTEANVDAMTDEAAPADGTATTDAAATTDATATDPAAAPAAEETPAQ
jgi:PBP1b-binding outer membrane lipoprotein LpoB